MSNRLINNLVFIITLIVFLVAVSMATSAVDSHSSNKAFLAVTIAYFIGGLAGWMAYSEFKTRKSK